METKKQRGQFFTTNSTVQAVLGALISHRTGRLLEPSAGEGHLVAWAETALPGLAIDAVELDPALGRVCATPIITADFFAYATGREQAYDVILGNPPFVAWKTVEDATVASAAAVKARYTDKTNLYHLFIDRCIDLLAPGGELVFIVPKEWLYTSSAAPLRSKLLAAGTLTHVVDCGEEKLFADADVPALLIFRFVAGTPTRHVLFAASLADAHAGTWTPRTLRDFDGRLLLVTDTIAADIDGWGRLGDQYSVRVGMVSGADSIYRLPAGADIEPSATADYLTTKGIERFLDVNHVKTWSDMPPKAAAHLTVHKATLLARKIAAFDETNWWRYGAIRNLDAMRSAQERFFAYAKTRVQAPFFTHPTARLFSGGILGIFRRPDAPVTVATAVKVLNDPRYRTILEAMFLTTGNKVSLQPATLEDAPFPPTEAAARTWLAPAPAAAARRAA